MQASLGRIVFGFIAATLAVVTLHQVIVWALGPGLGAINWLPSTSRAWSTAPFGPLGVPLIVNSMFWGGLWGALYGLIHEKLPGGSPVVKGLVYGLSIVVISNWLLLPLIKGQIFGQANQVLFAGYVPTRLAAGALILSGFGIATAVFYRLLRWD